MSEDPQPGSSPGSWQPPESPNQQLFELLCELTEFTVTGDHLRLLRHAYADRWDPGEGDVGAVGIELAAGEFRPGRYQRSPRGAGWQRAADDR